MIAAAAVALIATLLGVALALVPAQKSKLIGPIKSFALTASLAVVLTHLVPEGFAELGPAAMGVFFIGALLPALLGLTLRQLSRDRPIGLEVGYAGLVVHKIGDGLGLGAYAGPLTQGAGSLDVMIALGAHTVPVVAVIVLAFEPAYSRRTALLAALGLALSMLLGIGLTGLVPHEFAEQANAWVAAVVSGLLLHVVMHDLGAQAPETSGARTLDMAAALLGALVPTIASLGDHAHGHAAASELSAQLFVAFFDLALDTAPLLLLGLIASALIQSLGARLRPARLSTRGALRDALSGVVLSAPRPLAACGVLPLSKTLSRASAPALVVAFVLAAPQLGAETFLVGVQFLGWPLAVVRLGGALAVAILAGLLVAAITRAPSSSLSAEQVDLGHVHGGLVARTLRAFDQLLHQIGAWMVAGVAAAAALGALIPASVFSTLEQPLVELAAITALAIPSYVCAPAAVPLAAVLIAKGVSPGAVLVGLLLGPATNLATLALFRQLYGLRAALLVMVSMIGITWPLALVTSSWLGASTERHVADALGAEHGPVSLAASALLALLLLRSVWLSGVRGFLASLAELGGAAPHSHHHPHADEHDAC